MERENRGNSACRMCDIGVVACSPRRFRRRMGAVDRRDGPGDLQVGDSHERRWERFDCVRQTSDGGYILSGYTDSYGSGNGDGWCVKVNSTGKAAWQMTYGGAGTERLYSVLQTPTGGYVAAGYTDSFGEGTPNGFAIALDGTGQIDPGCGSLVQRSKAKISGARATRSIDSSTVSAGNVKNVTAGTRFATTKATDLLVCGAADE